MIYLIAGKAESGKSLFAEILKKKLIEDNCVPMIINYGDMVKYIAKQYYDWDGNKDEKGRALLQTIGTLYGRRVDKDYWVKIVENIITMLDESEAFTDYIIADCRFPNEIDYWKENFPLAEKITIKIFRPNYENHLTESQKQHISETALDDYSAFDYIVENSGTIEDLEDSVETILYDRSEWKSE